MFKYIDGWTQIGLEVLRGERRKGEILKREGILWETSKKILAHPEPPGYRIERPRPLSGDSLLGISPRKKI